MKKTILKAICLVMCFTMMAPAINVMAFDSNNAESAITPYWTYISNESCDMFISGNTAYVTADIECVPTVTKCTISVELQKKSGSSWKTVSTKGDTVYSESGMWDFDFPVTSGQTYRAKVTFTAYSGSKSEKVTDYTNSETA